MAKMKVPGGHMVGILPDEKKAKKPSSGKKAEGDKTPDKAPDQGQ